MDIKRINPWNWLRHEEDTRTSLPVERTTQSWSPFSQFQQLHRDIDALFDSVFTGMVASDDVRANESLLRPRIDVATTDKAYTLEVEIPGVEEKDIKLELTPDGLLTIRGEKKRETEHKDSQYVRVERSYGAFKRQLTLPEDADHDQIDAQFRNGVLSVTIPKTAEAKTPPKLIEIKSAA